MKLRRAQNRASQKAFRDRQAKRVKLLEEEFVRLQQSHHALNHAWAERAEEIRRLKAYIQELTNNIEGMKSPQEPSYDNFHSPEGNFFMLDGPDQYGVYNTGRTLLGGMEEWYDRNFLNQ